MSSYNELFSKIAKNKKAEELAREFLRNQNIVEKVASLEALCDLLEFKQDSKKLEEILDGKYTKDIPLLTVWRFWEKYNKKFGKKLVYGNKSITLSEIDRAFSRILREIYYIYTKIAGGVNYE